VVLITNSLSHLKLKDLEVINAVWARQGKVPYPTGNEMGFKMGSTTGTRMTNPNSVAATNLGKCKKNATNVEVLEPQW
jgi:hypothetical protein